MFDKIRNKFTELKDQITNRGDENASRMSQMVDVATDDILLGPDWAKNMEIVDAINHSAVGAGAEAMLRAVFRRLRKDNAKVQAFSLTLLEVCAKNCGSKFHNQLAVSEAWIEMQRLADPSKRVDPMVKGKVLSLIQEWAIVLTAQPEFAQVYNNLVAKHVLFPPREDRAALAAAYQQPPAAAAAAMPPNAGAAPYSDAFAGMSDADRAAVQAALRDLDSEAARQRPPPPTYPPAAAQQPPPAATYTPTPVFQPSGYAAVPTQYPSQPPTATGQPVPVGVPPSGQPPQQPPQHGGQQPQYGGALTTEQITKVQKDLEEAANRVEFLHGMLDSVPDNDAAAATQEYIADVARLCREQQPRIASLVQQVTDESLLSSALSLHDEGDKVLQRYDQFVTAAQAGMPVPEAARRQPAAQPPQQQAADASDIAVQLPAADTSATAAATAVAAAPQLLPPPTSNHPVTTQSSANTASLIDMLDMPSPRDAQPAPQPPAAQPPPQPPLPLAHGGTTSDDAAAEPTVVPGSGGLMALSQEFDKLVVNKQSVAPPSVQTLAEFDSLVGMPHQRAPAPPLSSPTPTPAPHYPHVPPITASTAAAAASQPPPAVTSQPPQPPAARGSDPFAEFQ